MKAVPVGWGQKAGMLVCSGHVCIQSKHTGTSITDLGHPGHHASSAVNKTCTLQESLCFPTYRQQSPLERPDVRVGLQPLVLLREVRV
eukprot:1160837-Pelagomonas_calceolata.AAC.11